MHSDRLLDNTILTEWRGQQVIVWGVGTALGELPPYLVAYSHAKAGEQDEDYEVYLVFWQYFADGRGRGVGGCKKVIRSTKYTHANTTHSTVSLCTAPSPPLSLSLLSVSLCFIPRDSLSS